MSERLRVTAVIVALGLVAGACGAADETGADGEPAATVSPTAAADGAVAATADVEAATVKIASEGTFVDPEVGPQVNAAGVGTGFLIDGSGITVTNNHVVTGAALLRVTVSGTDDPVNARVLGVSECSDLAVIELEGDGYPFLGFRSGEVRPGLDVFAAGYPLTTETDLDDVDYTLTRGIISAASTAGETTWASVDEVLEHDARIRGGNSGGPLVDTDGRVVGVNYAGSDQSDQNFAIAADEAQPIIERLRAGEDVESIGVNGQAVLDEEAGISGIWVASVASGSPADEAGIEPGDIITHLEDLQLATDGTMSDYCDVLRTNGSDDVMSVQVLRFSTQEVLEGQLNGDELVQSFSFAQEFEEEVPNETGGQVATYESYTEVTDDLAVIAVEVPAEWGEVDGSENPEYGPSIWAAPDLEQFRDTWDVPGILVEVSSTLGAGDIGPMMDQIGPAGACTSQGREPYEDPLYTGEVELWTGCGGTDTIVVTAAVVPEDGSFLIRILGQAVDDRDLDAMDRALNTFVAQP